MTASRRRRVLRARIAIAVVAATLVGQGQADANHSTCDNGAGGTCPALSVDLVAGPQVPFTDAVSGLTFRMSQPNHASPALDVTYLVPRGWKFTTASIRPAEANAARTVAAEQSTNSFVYTNLTAVGPAVTVTIPASGQIDLRLTATISNTEEGRESFMGFAAEGANVIAPSDAFAVKHTQARGPDGALLPGQRVGGTFSLGGLAPGSTTFTAKYRTTGGTARFRDRTIEILGLAATRCDSSDDGIYTGGVDQHTDGQPEDVGKAEILAGGVGMSARITPDPIDGQPATIEFGYRLAEPPPREAQLRRPSLTFLGWDGTTARLCLYLYANRAVLDAGGFPRYPPQQPREHMIPVELTKLTGDLDFGWSIHFDLTTVYNDPPLVQKQISVTQLLFYIESLTGGTWNTNRLTGARESINFSRTPSTPGRYEFRGIFRGCRDGIRLFGYDPPNGAQADRRVLIDDPLDFSVLCRTPETVAVTRSVFVDITPPPTSYRHRAARMTGPATLGLPAGYGLVRDATSVDLSWRQPAAEPGVSETVKAYALAIAVPGDEENMHFEYVVTDPADPSFDPRRPCGAEGTSASCTLTLEFPLFTTGEKMLTADGKYDVALVTVFADGHRTDGRCDDGTGPGRQCDPAERDFTIAGQGVSTWQFLIRSDPWPHAFVDRQLLVRSGTAGRATEAPNHLLLVDYRRHRAEFTFWNPLSRAESFFRASMLVQGDDDLGTGIVETDSGEIVSSAPAWRLLAQTDLVQATGFFTIYETNRISVLSERPTPNPVFFQGLKLP